MKNLLAILLILASSLSWGEAKNQLLGTWESNPTPEMRLTYTFKENNKFIWIRNSKADSLSGNYSIKQDKGHLLIEFKDFSTDPDLIIRCIIEFTSKDSFKIYGKRYKKHSAGEYPDKFGKDTIQFKKKK